MLLYFLLVSASFYKGLFMVSISSSVQSQYLHEMGIDQWELIHPERLTGYTVDLEVLPEGCKLLLVSDEKPEGKLAEMFERVVKSIKLDLSQALYIPSNQFASIESNTADWVWFAGCSSPIKLDAKVLQSPLLSEIDGNNQHRRDLWQQICAYD